MRSAQSCVVHRYKGASLSCLRSRDPPGIGSPRTAADIDDLYCRSTVPADATTAGAYGIDLGPLSLPCIEPLLWPFPRLKCCLSSILVPFERVCRSVCRHQVCRRWFRQKSPSSDDCCSLQSGRTAASSGLHLTAVVALHRHCRALDFRSAQVLYSAA